MLCCLFALFGNGGSNAGGGVCGRAVKKECVGVMKAQCAKTGNFFIDDAAGGVSFYENSISGGSVPHKYFCFPEEECIGVMEANGVMSLDFLRVSVCVAGAQTQQDKFNQEYANQGAQHSHRPVVQDQADNVIHVV